jgi:uncharacterized membrane protein YuzA (DUF378 family)
MDWIEKLFGVSPDGGSGTTELLFAVIPLAGLYLLLRIRRRGARGSFGRRA